MQQPHYEKQQLTSTLWVVIWIDSIRPLSETMHSIYLNLSLMDFYVFFAFESLANETSSVSFHFIFCNNSNSIDSSSTTTINTLTMTAAATMQLWYNVIELCCMLGEHCSHSVNQLFQWQEVSRFPFLFSLQSTLTTYSISLCDCAVRSYILKAHKSNWLYNFTALVTILGIRWPIFSPLLF